MIMTITLSKAVLSHSLDVVEKALSKQTTITYLENIFCEIESPIITLASTNLELFIKVSLPCEGKFSGKVLLPPKITDIVRLLPESEVTLELKPDNFQINLSSGRSRYNLFGADPEDYPSIEKILPKNIETVTIDPAELKQILKMVIFAASTEETRPAFNGILFEFDNNRWSLLGSDTYRLVVKNLVNENWNFPHKRCLVPAKALRELLKVVEQSEEKIILFPTGEQLIFDLGTVYFAARLLNEKYPDISSVVPEHFLTRVTVNRSNLAEAVGRAALLAEGPNNAVHFSVGDGSLVVQVSSPIGRMEEELPASYEGEDVDLYINSRFIMDILKAASPEEIIIDFHGKTGPVIFRLPEDNSYLYLVLPIKMN